MRDYARETGPRKSEDYLMGLVLDLLEEYEIYITHNTGLLKALPPAALFSNKVISEEFGIYAGANTFDFNAKYMKTDDNVFLYQIMKEKEANLNR